MTPNQITFIFEALKEMRKDIKELKTFKDICQGIIITMTSLAGMFFFVIKVMETF